MAGVDKLNAKTRKPKDPKILLQDMNDRKRQDKQDRRKKRREKDKSISKGDLIDKVFVAF